MDLKINIVRVICKIVTFVVPVKRQRVLFTSFPDLSDNSWALFKYYYNNSRQLEFVWLVESKSLAVRDKIKSYPNVKVIKRKSARGFFAYARAALVFHTHGIFSFNKIRFNNKKIIVNLWHGMPIKQVGKLDSKYTGPYKVESRKSHFAIATSEFYRDIISSSFAIPKECVLNFGLPRNDILYSRISRERKNLIFDELEISTDNKLILWLPTYRRSTVGDIRKDSDYDNFIDEIGDDFLRNIDDVAGVNNLQIVIKLHPMDSLNGRLDTIRQDFKSIKIISAAQWSDKKLDLYDVLAASELLISDLSSVLIDALPSRLKIATTTQDFSSYTREVIPKAVELWSEVPKLVEPDDLIRVIQAPKCLSASIINTFNMQADGNSCEQIFNYFLNLNIKYLSVNDAD